MTYQKDMNLEGKAAIVFGASRGLGQAISIGLAEAGADIAGVARSIEALAATEVEVTKVGRRFEPISCEATNSVSVNDAASHTEALFGKIDILVNCVGGALARPIQAMTDRDWQNALELNLSTVFYACRAVAPIMQRGGGGSIINIASTAGHRGRPGIASYSASKAAVINLTKAMAVEWADQGIRANCISPGRFLTDATAARMNDPLQYEEFVKLVPLRRIGQPDEMKAAAVWLASDASAFATGTELVLDGGQTLK
ncbi:SDR family NAD(P)-dependent oxidoreductase [Celeribacter sp.]|uniref:SDR family NAD(P)-dependent oxidoreductase n=1 Tax=Celeribacter sp. TaxID=1890673 RepID=UPI003A923281